MYAIFRAQGKQFRAEPDATLRLPTLDVEPGEQVTFDEVLLAERDGALLIGTPSLAGASVQAEVLGHGRGEKVVVFKMKRRKGYRRKQGHRQGFTEIRVVEIALEAPRPRKPKRPEAEQAPERAVTTEKAP
ncbi:MAG: 50S ribosomal protein L21, partial [Gemmatimonadota bacterium]